MRRSGGRPAAVAPSPPHPRRCSSRVRGRGARLLRAGTETRPRRRGGGGGDVPRAGSPPGGTGRSPWVGPPLTSLSLRSQAAAAGAGPGPCPLRDAERGGGAPRPGAPPMTLRSAEPLESAGGPRERWGRPGAAVAAAPVAEEPREAARLAAAMEELRRAGWYWGSMSVAEAKERLQDAPEGTFLVRDSSHSEYLLTISVKTSAGPTNLRIEYQDGKFRLDSITCVRSRLKQFNSVVHLIEYYVLMCKERTETPSNGTVHLYLNKPLYTSAPSLQHRCRITINKCTNQIWELPLPTRLKEYLKEYRYQV
ncbi:suppressor of cytokine signaling 2 isoform X1 [Oxyura jamaicensis]|uniref:suppressor of cytokine signaling 2 isoform X1 n=2 Tax=Oxyura jamaicensis TaxID=8884 RepID=UPI0015A54042|nr:suppressor of cytokine signaling 2 isoform X1 [Oxyura jamaicensis]